MTRFIIAETEGYWSRRAGMLRPATLWREVRRHRRATTREAEEAHRRRYLELWWDPEHPVLYLQGQVGSEQGAALEAALTRAAEQVGLTVLLCHAHHRLLHEGGWSVSGHPASDLRFHDPGGRPVRTMPHAVPSEVGAPFG